MTGYPFDTASPQLPPRQPRLPGFTPHQRLGSEAEIETSGRSSDEAMNEVANRSLLKTLQGHDPFRTILADPPWRFQNRTGKMAPEHLRLARYPTMTLDGIKALPVGEVSDERCH